jgi:lipooligosaccharide transport system ATP-binding protein
VQPADVLVEANGLTKCHPPRRRGASGFVAVDGVDFAVRQGQSFGILGPNGAGKSSTMRMIACVSPVSGRRLTVLGVDPATQGRAVRARFGVVPQDEPSTRRRPSGRTC